MSANCLRDGGSVSRKRAIAGRALHLVLAVFGLALEAPLHVARSYAEPGDSRLAQLAQPTRLPPVDSETIHPAAPDANVVDAIDAAADAIEALPIPVAREGAFLDDDLPLESLYPSIEVLPPGRTPNGAIPPRAVMLQLPPVTLAHTPLNFNVPLLLQQSEYAWDTHLPPEDAFQGIGFDMLVRGAYINDQRIEWSGNEATFLSEAILGATYRRMGQEWLTTVRGEFYLNQPFDRNQLVDNTRLPWMNNFEVDIYEISQLFVSAQKGNFMMSIGKIITPFGRAYFPIYENSREDAPFIRTESILWRETGVLFQYAGGLSVISAGLVNGGIDKDTNSSKALIGRVGFGRDNFAIGSSIKWQDGIGSEHQKLRRNHLGFDAMYRWGRCQFSAEGIYDEYGFRKSGNNLRGELFTAEDIRWGRSIYYRDTLPKDGKKLKGLGYYVNLNVDFDRWLLMLNYGEYYPRQIGDPRHDQINRRGIVKAVYRFGAQFEFYGMVLREDDLPNTIEGRTRTGTSVLSGLQFLL